MNFSSSGLTHKLLAPVLQETAKCPTLKPGLSPGVSINTPHLHRLVQWRPSEQSLLLKQLIITYGSSVTCALNIVLNVQLCFINLLMSASAL